MRIAFVFYDMPGYYGGPNVNARRLLPALKGRGHEPIGLVAYHQGAAPAADYLEQQGVSCRRSAWHPWTVKHIHWYLEQLKDLKPDVFVPNLSVAGWFAARWAREAGIPTIAAHRSDDAFHWGMVEQFVTGSPEWAVSGLVCVGLELQQAVEARRPARTRLCVIPSGVPVPVESLASHAPLKLIYIGRLKEEQKNISLVADSLASVLRAYPDATAEIIGTGPEKPRIEQRIATSSLDGRLRLTGGVPPDQLHGHLAGTTAILLLSDYEGTPGALMDAMACGIVPICTDLFGGTRELVEHEKTGLVVTKDPGDVLTAVRRLAEDRALWQRLSTAARERVAASYSLDVAATRWERFCEALLAEAGPRRPLTIPRRLHLPPVHPGLAREDVRWWHWKWRQALAALSAVWRLRRAMRPNSKAQA